MDTSNLPPPPPLSDLFAAANRFVEERPEYSDADAQDLGRLSVQASIQASADREDRFQVSTGRLRLHGAGASEHSAPLDAVGPFISILQRLAASFGAALLGHKSLDARNLADVQRRTRLLLTASPGPGSLVLDVRPAADPDAELHPGGQSPLGRDLNASALADESMIGTLELLSTASASSVTADAIVERLTELGPGVASALLQLVRNLSGNDLDLDVAWRMPNQAARKANLTHVQAGWLKTVMDARNLDAEPFTLFGTAHVVSAGEPWTVASGGTFLTINVRAVPLEQLTAAHPLSAVRITGTRRIREVPGRGDTVFYSAESIQVLESVRERVLGTAGDHWSVGEPTPTDVAEEGPQPV